MFDEYHFGRFTNQYNDRQFLFDIHPPLGKLVFFWVSRLTGYDHTVCEYEGCVPSAREAPPPPPPGCAWLSRTELRAPRIPTTL